MKYYEACLFILLGLFFWGYSPFAPTCLALSMLFQMISSV